MAHERRMWTEELKNIIRTQYARKPRPMWRDIAELINKHLPPGFAPVNAGHVSDQHRMLQRQASRPAGSMQNAAYKRELVAKAREARMAHARNLDNDGRLGEPPPGRSMLDEYRRQGRPTS